MPGRVPCHLQRSDTHHALQLGASRFAWREDVDCQGLRVAESRSTRITQCPPNFANFTLKTPYSHWKAPRADALMAALIFSLHLFGVILHTTPFLCQYLPLAETALLLPISHPAPPTDSSHGHPPSPILCFASQCEVPPALLWMTGSPSLSYLNQSRLSSSSSLDTGDQREILMGPTQSLREVMVPPSH